MRKNNVLMAVFLAAISFPALISATRTTCDDIKNCTRCTENKKCECESYSDWLWTDLPCIKKNGDAYGFLWNFDEHGRRFDCKNFEGTIKPLCSDKGVCKITSSVWFGELINGVSECYEAEKDNRSFKEVFCTNLDNINSSTLYNQYSSVATKINNVSTELDGIKTIIGKVKFEILVQNLTMQLSEERKTGGAFKCNCTNEISINSTFSNHLTTSVTKQIADEISKNIENIAPKKELGEILEKLEIQISSERESRSMKNHSKLEALIQNMTQELMRSNSDIKELLKNISKKKQNLEPNCQIQAEKNCDVNGQVQNLSTYIFWGAVGVVVTHFMLIVLLVIFLVNSNRKSSKKTKPEVSLPMEKIIMSADKVSLNSEVVVENDLYGHGAIGNYH